MSEPESGRPAGEKLCPSSHAEPGAILLGIVGSDGRIGYVTPQLRIDSGFVESSKEGRAPEKRFRFAGPCIETGCAQWSDNKCGVIESALQAVEGIQGLPKCSIRPRCRWFSQRGSAACAVCPLIVTDPGERAD